MITVPSAALDALVTIIAPCIRRTFGFGSLAFHKPSSQLKRTALSFISDGACVGLAAVKAPSGSRVGQYVETSVGGEKVRAFVPAPLPPVPSLDFTRFLSHYDRARGALGRLDGLTTILP